MHIPDGFVSPLISLPAYAAAAPLWAWAARRHFGPQAVEALPVIGSLTALSFVIQTIMIPLPGGTSAHLLGVMLLALLYHPLVAFLCESLVLLMQAMFFGAGGITVLGINALAMGLLGPWAGWLVWKALKPLSERVAMFAAGWLSMQVATILIVGVLTLQHRLDPGYFPIPPAISWATMMVPTLAITGVLEGLYTAFAYSLVRRAHFRGINGEA
jgi:cobalt/nickel transport system permease protein